MGCTALHRRLRFIWTLQIKITEDEDGNKVGLKETNDSGVEEPGGDLEEPLAGQVAH